MANLIKLPPVQNVAANSIAVLDFPLGDTYHAIHLQRGGTFTAAHVTDIKLKLNGKVFFQVSGTMLDLINAYRGLTAVSGFLTIDFTDPIAKSLAGQIKGSIGTAAGVAQFSMEVTIGAATSPTLTAFAEVSPGTPLGLINGLIKYPWTLAAGGKYPLALPHGESQPQLIQRLYVDDTGGPVVTHTEVQKNSVVVHGSDIPIVTNRAMQTQRGTKPQTNVQVVDFILDGNSLGALNTLNAQSLYLYLTLSATGTVNVYAEVLALLRDI
jgi:hypothetical protein